MRGSTRDILNDLQKRIERLECSHPLYAVAIAKKVRTCIMPPYFDYIKRCSICGETWDVTEKEYLQYKLDDAKESCKKATELRKQMKEIEKDE